MATLSSSNLIESQNSLKVDRRLSTTSESSIEPMDLGRTPTPKKYKIINNNNNNNEINNVCNNKNISESSQDSDEEDPKILTNKLNKKLESQEDSFRKKFRINSTPHRSPITTSLQIRSEENGLNDETSVNNPNNENFMSNNESGFVDTTNTTNLNNSLITSSPESGIGERDEVKYVCPICDIVSATPHEFTNHIRCHNYTSGNPENFTCRICSKILSSASSLDRHVLVHTGERPFNCKYCHLTFTTNGNMHRHMRTHKQHQQHHQRKNSKVIANNGNNIGNASSVTKDNDDGNKINPYCSPNNANSTESTINLTTNKMSNSNGEYNENYDSDAETDESDNNNNNCNNNNFSSISNHFNINSNKRKNSTELDESGILLKRRMKTINNNIIHEICDNNHLLQQHLLNQQKYCCPVCNRNDFISMLTLGSHMDTEHPDIPAKCRQCDVVFKTHKQLNAHRCTINNKQSIAQGFNDLTFVDFSSEKFPLIAKSLCEQTLRTPITKQKFECFKCYRAFPCTTSLEIHNKDCDVVSCLPTTIPHDLSVQKPQMSESESEGEDNKRDDFFAHLDLRNKSAMSMEESSFMSSPHASEKSDFKENDKVMNLNSNQNNPMLNDSKDLADIQSILNVTSSSNNFLKNFEQTVNTPSSECGYGKDEEEAQDAFTAEFRKMKLRGEFPCKLCAAVFPNLRALKGHNRIHLSAAGAAGPFRCNMCPYSIHDKAALVRHMRTHNGDRPYECAVCNYAFTTKANCERHLRNRHAKTTREEVKRAIIYHPSEDSSCDDPTKKIHLFSSPDFDQDDDNHHQLTPKDRSTPVSHLKEMLQNQDHKSMKIQVKSLEKLIDKAGAYGHNFDERKEEYCESQCEPNRPIDLSMDVLDLSKKSTKQSEEKQIEVENEAQSKIDFSLLEKQQQLLLAQQQFLSDTLPKMDPASYFQLYRNLVFPSLNPFFLQNTFLPNGLGDLNKFAPLMNPFGTIGPNPASPIQNANPSTNILQQSQQQLSPPKEQDNALQKLTPSSQLLPKTCPDSSTSTLMSQISQHTSLQNHQVQQQTSQHQQPEPLQQISSGSSQRLAQPSPQQNNGPVKMVIKNGVLMPKQKQRRYRTERPFACEHCSARFTLRSNMERHIKQQHPQFWAQRQRNGQHVMRGRGSSSNIMSQMPSTRTISDSSMNNNITSSNNMSAISDQVKFAILAQQLKARKETDILQQALSAGNSGFSSNNNGSMEDDAEDPKLVIDEDNEDEEDDDEEELDDQNDIELIPGQEYKSDEITNDNSAAKKVAETILEQAIKASSNKQNITANPMKEFELKLASSMIARAESVGKSLKQVASSPFKDESPDLVSVSKLVDNATNPLAFNNYFRPSDVVNHMEQSDEEGLVASGSASDNNSGTEEASSNQNPEQKKKSAYSLAPNRVSCPYCQRMFPWSSSLRRHILTHTGQKPFKCSHCPLLFTTKSNCDRHLLRKHGNVESAMSLYVPIDDVSEPIPPPKPVAVAKLEAAAAAQQKIRNQECLNSTDVPDLPRPNFIANGSQQKPEPVSNQSTVVSSSDLPFKCHLCDSSFGERMQCLEHIRSIHAQEFTLLLAKGAIDTEATVETANQHNPHSTEDEDKRDESRKYPDYNNRKVICAFCVRKFWSTEDLRRHMRTHSGERPFQCSVCMRKFTLKHSMLRHMKKHNGNNINNQTNPVNSGSDLSDDEQSQVQEPISQFENQLIRDQLPILSSGNTILANSLRNHKIQQIFNKVANNWHSTVREQHNNLPSATIKQEYDDMNSVPNTAVNTDLIGNLLGISDQGILNKLLSSADEAAKLLGIKK